MNLFEMKFGHLNWNCELNWDEILMVEFNRELNFDAMCILKNLI